MENGRIPSTFSIMEAHNDILLVWGYSPFSTFHKGWGRERGMKKISDHLPSAYYMLGTVLRTLF